MPARTEKQSTQSFIQRVVNGGTCTGCGLCAGLDSTGKAVMADTPKGPRPFLHAESNIPEVIRSACPGSYLPYPEIYQKHYGNLPADWLTGIVHRVYTGYSGMDSIRQNASSGGVLTQVLIYLLETGRIDGAILVRQGIPEPEKARVFIATTASECRDASQSVYIPVSVLDILNKLEPRKCYAITCLPEQSAALRMLQQAGFPPALQVKYILGPYTGTALYPKAISVFKKISRIKSTEKVCSLKWRAGEWPGYLELVTESGKVVRSPKVYYNFLIPFFVTNSSLQSMDFTNEFADLAVGDAWSPEFESQGKGFSVVLSRTPAMTKLLEEMRAAGLLFLEEHDTRSAGVMHQHMIDFKKRGSYIRNRFRRLLGRRAPEFGYKPARITFSRILVEVVISGLFLLGKTSLFRMLLFIFPEKFLGPLFNRLRLRWKKLSKKTKRKGLEDYQVILTKKKPA